MEKSYEAGKARWQALIPFGIFLVFYFGLSLWAGDFYKIPMTIAFLVASASAMLLNSKQSFEEKTEIFARGMGEPNIMLMCLIFLLAGAFSAIAREMGAVGAAVQLTRQLIPSSLLLPGIFAVSCLISLAIGTSCGTIAALTPIAIGFVPALNTSPELMLGAVIGGAMFGDNLSMISDTTIAATRTQNVAMRDKFRANFLCVLPAALLTLLIYFFCCRTQSVALPQEPVGFRQLLLILPYILILILALCGLHVMPLLFCGVVLAALIGVFTGCLDFWQALGVCGKGTLDMSETLIVALLAGGLLNVIRQNGGLAYLIERIGTRIHTERGCEFGVFLLVSIVNLFTANNTVAIVIAGPIAREFSQRCRCSPVRIAGILDTGSCFIQGIIPYGAQLLIAVGVAKSSGLAIETLPLLRSCCYQWLMAFFVLGAIFLHRGANFKNQ